MSAPDSEQLKDLLARAPDGPWTVNYAFGEISGGASGCYPVIEMNESSFDAASATVDLDDSEMATLDLCALSPTLAADVISLREDLEAANRRADLCASGQVRATWGMSVHNLPSQRATTAPHRKRSR